MSTPEKRCGKRKNKEFPFKVEEMKRKLIDNVDRLKQTKTNKQIRGMKRKELCKYFVTKNNTTLKFNMKLVKKTKSKKSTNKPKNIKNKIIKKKSPKKSSSKKQKKSNSQSPGSQLSKSVSKISPSPRVSEDGEILFLTKNKKPIYLDKLKQVINKKDVSGANKVVAKDNDKFVYNFRINGLDYQIYDEKDDLYLSGIDDESEPTLLSVLMDIEVYKERIKKSFKALNKEQKLRLGKKPIEVYSIGKTKSTIKGKDKKRWLITFLVGED